MSPVRLRKGARHVPVGWLAPAQWATPIFHLLCKRCRTPPGSLSHGEILPE